MTIIISVLNQKGGSGKTTISSNLAHAIALDGRKVLLVDSDPQGSLRDWNEANGGELIPVVGLDRETLPKDLKAISDSYDFVIIDGAPQIAKMSVAAVKAANLVLIPVQPSPYDIWACADLVDIITARQEVTDGLPIAYFLISRAIKNTKLGNEIKSALVDYELPVMTTCTTQKVAYPTTAAEGKTVFNEPASSAAKEITAIKTEIMEIVNYGA
ncbi:ParA family partition ATPase [Pleurocapsa sp. PCC 7319]|uniref:ParA family partition ATPase n=1 Tax=Pleurocapsa sp. PCC 7319 TaxID=118161 RepID=UPI0003477235|nr:ParA family partition ATPase [Pleurocapsa sp. PCC 7319]